MRSLNFMARSRFTGVPDASRPSVVTESVSGDTSTVKLLSVLEMAVRQTPFTLTLSPILRSPITVEARIVSLVPARGFSIDVTAPISSTIPVNIRKALS